jgi:hypothetical protein
MPCVPHIHHLIRQISCDLLNIMKYVGVWLRDADAIRNVYDLLVHPVKEVKRNYFIPLMQNGTICNQADIDAALPQLLEQLKHAISKRKTGLLQLVILLKQHADSAVISIERSRKAATARSIRSSSSVI